MSDNLSGRRKRGSVSQSKAKEIMRDGTAQGHPLTDKQRGYFGMIASGKMPTKSKSRIRRGK